MHTHFSPPPSAPKYQSPCHDTFSNTYTRSPVSSNWAGQVREYPNPTADLNYPFNDREDDKCTISPKESFEAGPTDEECVSFFSAPTPTPMDPDSDDGKDDSDDSEAGVVPPDAESITLTTLGPKMRFVSPAPWEAQGESYDDDGDDNISLSDSFSVFSGRFNSRKHREHEKVSIRSLALATMRTPSPTPTTSSRRGPYGRFNSNATQSQISLSMREAPWASRSTLESPSSERQERPSFSFSVHDRGASSPGSLTERSLKQKVRTQVIPLSQDDTSSIVSPDSPVSINHYPHPYANPDVIPVSDSPKLPSGVEATHHQHRQSNESDPGYVRRASEPATVATPVASTFRKGSAGNLPVPHNKTSYKPMLARHEEAEIALLPPMPMPRREDFPTAGSPQMSHSSVPFPDSPMSNLMTLEEAQQRVKKPSSESPIQARVRTGSTLVAGFGLQPGVDFEVRRNQPSSPLSPSDSSSFTIREPPKSSNARQRTISGATRMSTATSSSPNDDVGSTKTLKHKKSGFMRLFGKDKDKDTSPHKVDSPSIEPVPPMPKRISPPSLSVVVTSPSISFPENKIQVQQPDFSPPREQAPPSPATIHISPAETDRLQSGHSLDHRPVLSAPPSQTTFEGLSLRPMSTVFSSKFSDLFSALDDPEESLTPPVMPAATKPAAAGSPTTSDFSSRSNSSDYPITPASIGLPGVAVSIVGGRQPEDTIASLQTQLVNMRKNHQREIWELESRIKDLKLENQELRNDGMCETCGKSKREGRLKPAASAPVSVVDRPRPKVSRDVRSVFGGN